MKNTPTDSSAGVADTNIHGREYYEIRTYSLESEAQRERVEAYFETAAIPAMNRLGIDTVGVFTEMEPSAKPKLYVLIVYPSIGKFLNLANGDLLGEGAYLSDAASYLDTPKDLPAYERIQSSLLVAFEGMPRISVPEAKTRIFELRQYESHSEAKARKKIEMFDSAEIDIFLKTGLSPVFFGEMVVGEKMPNLTYMVTFDDVDTQTRCWQSFVDSAEWKELSGREEYADTVSNITKTMLVPAGCSQI
jgi:hypothetical protein